MLEPDRRIDLLHKNIRKYGTVSNTIVEATRPARRQLPYVDGAVVLTPNPRNHALFADKRNLILLSDQEALKAWGLKTSHVEALAGLPRAARVTTEKTDELWSGRKNLFSSRQRATAANQSIAATSSLSGIWAT